MASFRQYGILQSDAYLESDLLPADFVDTYDMENEITARCQVSPRWLESDVYKRQGKGSTNFISLHYLCPESEDRLHLSIKNERVHFILHSGYRRIYQLLFL